MCPIGGHFSSPTRPLEPQKATLWILLVGVNNYEDAGLPPLQYSMADCQGLAEAWAEVKISMHKVAIVHHDESEEPPLAKNVRASLQKIVDEAKPEDTILLYFSGHGALEPESQRVVLCLADTQKSDLLGTGLELQEVLRLLAKSSARQQLVWLDACHSGGMKLSGARSETQLGPQFNPAAQILEVVRQRAAQSKGFYAILSCDREEKSWEFSELGHGLFTYYLMRGLRGEAADLTTGAISVDSIYEYVYKRTQRYIDNINLQLRLINQQKLSRGETEIESEYKQQTPQRIMDGAGSIILGVKPNNSVSPHHPRQAFVLEGLVGSRGGLDLAKALNKPGGFKVVYWSGSEKATAENLRQAIRECLLSASGSRNISKDPAKTATVFLYLRGRIEKTDEGEEWLVLGDGGRLTRSWLRQELRRSQMVQQIVVLDCPKATSLVEWVEDLQGGPEQSQCLLAAAAKEPEHFATALLKTLHAENPFDGLAIAKWISQLQGELKGTGIKLHSWLAGVRGVIEVLPSRIGSQGIETTHWIGVCPFMGFRPFREKDAPFYYGRKDLTQQLINTLSHQSLITVLGASGSGKSSVLHAKLIPELRRGRQLPRSEEWWIGSFNPGSNPISALSQRLVDWGTQEERKYQEQVLEGRLHSGVEGFVRWLRNRNEPMVVLIVDQFEELFTMAAEKERRRFLEIVLGALEQTSDRFKLIISLRLDFLNSCLKVPILYEALQKPKVLVPPYLTPDDCEEAIVEPARSVGLEVERELVDVLRQDMEQSAADLSELQFILEQLWLRASKEGVLTLKAYYQLGGIKKAFERKVQKFYDNLKPEEQKCAKWILLQLINVGEGIEHTRRRIPKSELVVRKYPPPLVETTLQKLESARLVVTNSEPERIVGQSRGAAAQEPESEDLLLERMKQEVTIENENLIRYWPTLRWWLEENRTQLQQQEPIVQAAREWKQNGWRHEYLLWGTRLVEAEGLYIKYSDELSLDVQQFIEACLAERDRQEREWELQRQQKLQQQIKLRKAAQKLTRYAIAFTVVVSVVAIFAFSQWYEAQKNSINALSQTSEASLLANRQLEALVAAVQSGKRSQNPLFFLDNSVRQTASAALQRAVYNVQERNRLGGQGNFVRSVRSVAYSPDGKTIASGSRDNTIKLWDVARGNQITTLSGHGGSVTSLAYSPDGKTIASGSVDNTIKLWDVARGNQITTLSGHGGSVTSLAYSPDGKTIASGSRDNTIKLWDVARGNQITTLNGQGGSVTSVAYSPDGKTIASGSVDTVKLWDVARGNQITTLNGQGGSVTSVAYSPDGRRLLLVVLTQSNRMARLLVVLTQSNFGM
ncbi:MAG: Tol-Pal system protein TolB [Chroococcidiopsis sp. SAG 2025]|nr:caspase family protein [Chroococcidiopsis sp. SAG 2025]MDV2997331.1 Tol-Pal system protein TolB [Chroococcidiopsis sp. SAG 2025]